MLALGVGITLTRVYYVETTPAGVLSAEAAGGVFDTLVGFLRTSLRAIGVAALVVALAAFLAGPSSVAVRTRATFSRGVGSARGSAPHAGWQTGRVGAWLVTHRRGLQGTILFAGGVVLMFLTQPTAWTVAWIALAVVLALALLELLRTAPAAAEAVDDPTAVPVPGVDRAPGS